MKGNLFLKLIFNKLILILFSNIFCIPYLFSKVSFFSNSKYHDQDKADEIKRIRARTNQAKNLVEDAIKYFMSTDIAKACYDFVYNAEWRKGELAISVINDQNICLAFGDNFDLFWQDISKYKSFDNRPLTKEMLNSDNGRFLGYMMNHSYQSAYVRSIIKDGVKYAISAGFFPQSSEYTAEVMASSAAAYFDVNGKDNTFDLISQYYGPFRKGSVYTFAFDFDGVCVANGRNIALVGQNLYDSIDDKGNHQVQDFINVAQKKGSGWVSYYWLGSFKKTYVIKVTDPKTNKNYVICAGYYPKENMQATKDFVHEAVDYLKANGAQKSFSEFTNKVGSFIRGSFSIFAFDMNGTCVADGLETGLVGQNLLKRVDQHGKYYVQEILRVAKKYNRGIATYYMRNGFTLVYVMKVHIPDGKFVICCGYNPDSKIQAIEGFVNKAIDYFRNNNRFEAFSRFSSKRGGFVQGDISMFVYNAKGVLLVDGFQKNEIWSNFSRAKDQSGKPVLVGLIDKALSGGGWYSFQALNTTRKVFVKSVEKDDQVFILGSGFFL